MEILKHIKDRLLTGMMSFFRKIRRVKTVPGRLDWKEEDYRIGKGWARSRPHPYDSKKTLWDFLASEKDSTLVLHELNKAINNEKNKKNS